MIWRAVADLAILAVGVGAVVGVGVILLDAVLRWMIDERG